MLVCEMSGNGQFQDGSYINMQYRPKKTSDRLTPPTSHASQEEEGIHNRRKTGKSSEEVNSGRPSQAQSDLERDIATAIAQNIVHTEPASDTTNIAHDEEATEEADPEVVICLLSGQQLHVRYIGLYDERKLLAVRKLFIRITGKLRGALSSTQKALKDSLLLVPVERIHNIEFPDPRQWYYLTNESTRDRPGDVSTISKILYTAGVTHSSKDRNKSVRYVHDSDYFVYIETVKGRLQNIRWSHVSSYQVNLPSLQGL